MVFYVHPMIHFFDVRNDPTMDPKEIEGNCYLHTLVFQTDLPKCLEMKDAHDQNPYHCLFYMISRFYFFDDGSNEIVYYYKKKDEYFAEQALACLPERFHRQTEKFEGLEYVEFPGCYWKTDSIDESWIYKYVRDLYKPIWEPIQQIPGKRVFISRKSAKHRKLLQEAELFPLLRQRGFSFYELETLTFEDQIRLFRSAEIIVGPHGAGFSWLIFCCSGTTVCEINKDEPGKNHYYDISLQCHLNYYRYVNCIWDPITEDISLDPQHFAIVMDHLIRQKK
jgi:hypothetical protein